MQVYFTIHRRLGIRQAGPQLSIEQWPWATTQNNTRAHLQLILFVIKGLGEDVRMD